VQWRVLVITFWKEPSISVLSGNHELLKKAVLRSNVRIFLDITPELVVFVPGISACELSATRSVIPSIVHNLVYLCLLYYS
jgi:hypothetical protein